jgi:hypothetical protein
MFTGDLKGNAGADAKCRAAAGASSYADVKSRASKFIAWVASGAPGSPGPGSRLAKAEYRRADGVLVARSLDALVGGDLMAPINVTEYGDSVGAGEAAWTGTTGNGATSAFTCNGWSSAFLTAAGNVGAPHDTGTTWTVGLPVTCSSDLRLYCVESGN